MSYELPTLPTELPTNVIDTHNDYSPDLLGQSARYSQELAEHREREARLAEKANEDDFEKYLEDLPSDVPSKATITIEEINDNRYYYW